MKRVLIVFSLIIFSCSQDDEAKTNYSGECDFETTISASRFANTTSDQFKMNSLAMEGDCLKINFGASGCSRETWLT